MTIALNSCQGLLGLLTQDQESKLFALHELLKIVDTHWPEISDQLLQIEQIYSTTTFPDTKLAALLCSKIYYHLGELNDSLQFALKAKELFDLNQESEYCETIIGNNV